MPWTSATTAKHVSGDAPEARSGSTLQDLPYQSTGTWNPTKNVGIRTFEICAPSTRYRRVGRGSGHQEISHRRVSHYVPPPIILPSRTTCKSRWEVVHLRRDRCALYSPGLPRRRQLRRPSGKSVKSDHRVGKTARRTG